MAEPLGIEELKKWLRIDFDDDDLDTLPALISTSKLIIKQSTGVALDDVEEDADALNLYKTLQKYIITDLYENRTGSTINQLVISLYSQLEVYKLPETIQ